MVRLTTRKNLGIEKRKKPLRGFPALRLLSKKFSDELCSSHAESIDKSKICVGWNDGKKMEHLNSYKVEF